jgi:hypothetical protein
VSYPLALAPEQTGLCRVLDAQGLHVGNLKLIGAVWKFKAIGYGADGELMPGGGPLTERHNARFDKLDAAEINAVLGRSKPSVESQTAGCRSV